MRGFCRGNAGVFEKKNVVRGGKKRERKARRSNGKSKRQCRLDKRLKRQTVVRRPCVTNTSQLPTFIAFICRRKKNLPPSKSIRLYEKSPRSICRKIIKQMIRFSKSEKKGQRLVVPNWRCEFPRILFEISLQLTLYFFLCWEVNHEIRCSAEGLRWSKYRMRTKTLHVYICIKAFKTKIKPAQSTI